METNEMFVPIHAVHPFDILKDELEARGFRQKDFAKALNMQGSNFSRMLREKPDLTAEVALMLEKELGIPFGEWMSFQERYMRDKLRIYQSPKLV
ncbi:MAG: hypothetical protein NC095_06165 [Muribaculum sp.]|nr:hypothetical protein [Muribaculum sp.]